MSTRRRDRVARHFRQITLSPGRRLCSAPARGAHIRYCTYVTFVLPGSRHYLDASGLQMFLSRVFKSERRRRSRQLLNTEVQVFSGRTHVRALSINFSNVGMCLFTATHLPVGSQIEAEFFRPGSTELVRVSGVVRHRALYLYGIEFLTSSDQSVVVTIAESTGPSQLANS
jgi:hypothetical protein